MIKRIKVGTGSCGIAAGADEVYDYLSENIDDKEVVEVGCIGHCYAEPIVEVETEARSYFFENVEPTEKDTKHILQLGDNKRLEFPEGRKNRELKKVYRLAGDIEPTSLSEYQEKGGFNALNKALKQDPSEIIEEVKDSGLRGRGGAGFPTGLKWSFLAEEDSEEKILICNADEGDPGAFMDKSLMENVPYQVIEGMLIAAYATDATELFIYIRAEYPRAINHLKSAIERIIKKELNVINGRKIDINIKEGAGAFVCGEETAMINSLEGGRGTPSHRPPYPTDKGFQDKPTLINNVESFANIPLIIEEGSEKYAEVGTENSKGTKLFSLAGDLEYTGIIEVPIGITLSEIVYDIGGAERGEVKAVQIGGPSGGCIPAKHFDTPVDYDSLNELGAIMGSGGLIVIGKDRCMVETARYFLDFTARESCGKCTFCRVGTTRLLESLERITGGEGTREDLELLEDLSPKIVDGSLCGLGQTAPNPVLSTLRYFKDEYIAHVEDKYCQALKCNNLVEISVDHDTCIECQACVQECPVNAISEDIEIDEQECTRCNSCIEVCPVDAISRTHLNTKGEENE